MRMISRREALEIIEDHSRDPDDCPVGGCSWDCLVKYGQPYCARFDNALGIHDQYAVIDVKNWLGY